MKITVDTKNDSPDQISKVIEMLSSLLKKPGQKPVQRLIAPSPPVTSAGKKESLVSFEVFSSEHSPGFVESTAEVSGLFTDSKEEEVKIAAPKIVEKVEREKPSYKQI